MNNTQCLYGMATMICGIGMLCFSDNMINQLWGIGINIIGILITGISYTESK